MRLKPLDVLRAVAVLLVLFRHYSFEGILSRGGWSGVDLFFVLSGFLISGLLFTEYKRSGGIRFGRFLVRRGFKIYPAFYVFIGWTVGMFLLHGGQLRPVSLASELFFLQSYVPAMWPHTWSLAVEEHFYLALPLALLLMCGLSSNRENPFRALPWLFSVIALGSLALRVWLCQAGPAPLPAIVYPTHLNVDGLLFGVFLSYLYHFRRGLFDRVASLPAWALLAASIALIAPCFVLRLEESRFLQTLGHPMLYLGYGGFLVFAVGRPLATVKFSIARMIGDALATLGRYSYSVYLWHHAVALWGLELLRRWNLLPDAVFLRFLIYVSCAFALGVGMGRLVEIPALKLRDRLFPSCGSALEPRDSPVPIGIPGSSMVRQPV